MGDVQGVPLTTLALKRLAGISLHCIDFVDKGWWLRGRNSRMGHGENKEKTRSIHGVNIKRAWIKHKSHKNHTWITQEERRERSGGMGENQCVGRRIELGDKWFWDFETICVVALMAINQLNTMQSLKKKSQFDLIYREPGRRGNGVPIRLGRNRQRKITRMACGSDRQWKMDN